ncbi:DUF2971 domain-containing protein [Desulfovibrio falkowii]|uniref:DUF2971 domain-containing protein n=1 Tax=Desulfovibrio sp. WGS1351 TaxID=3366814 RepID=UPI00372CE91C
MTQPVPPTLYKYMPEERKSFFNNPQFLFTFPEYFNDYLDCEARVKGVARPSYVEDRVQTEIEKVQEESPDFIQTIYDVCRAAGENFLNILNDKEKCKEVLGPVFSNLEMLMEKNNGTEQNKNSKVEALEKGKYDFPEMIKEVIKGVGQDFFGIEAITEWLNMAPAMMAELASELELSQNELVDKFIQNVNSKLKSQNIGILCLTEDYTSDKMWGLYTNAHAGFVLGLDTENKLFQALKNADNLFGPLKKVSYKPEDDLAYITDYVTDEIQKSYEFLNDTIFTKNDQWEYEKEWRIVINAPKHLKFIPKGILISVPPAIVKSVYLGTRVVSGLQEEATAFCKEHDIPLFRMKSSRRRLEALSVLPVVPESSGRA